MRALALLCLELHSKLNLQASWLCPGSGSKDLSRLGEDLTGLAFKSGNVVGIQQIVNCTIQLKLEVLGYQESPSDRQIDDLERIQPDVALHDDALVALIQPDAELTRMRPAVTEIKTYRSIQAQRQLIPDALNTEHVRAISLEAALRIHPCVGITFPQ